MIFSIVVSFLTILVPMLVNAQSSGTMTVTATGSGCVILAQIATLSTPFVLTQAVPICPGTSNTVNWPLSSGGDGASSSLAIYASITGGTSPGCVTHLTQMQAMYLLGRSLEWREADNQLFDNTAGGFIVDPTSYQPIVCGTDAAYLPSGLTLPDPSTHDKSDGIWTQAITLNPGAGAVTTLKPDPTTASSTIVEIDTSTSEKPPVTSIKTSSVMVNVDTSSAVPPKPSSSKGQSIKPSTMTITSTSTVVITPSTSTEVVTSTSTITESSSSSTASSSSSSPSVIVVIDTSTSTEMYSTTSSPTSSSAAASSVGLSSDNGAASRSTTTLTLTSTVTIYTSSSSTWYASPSSSQAESTWSQSPLPSPFGQTSSSTWSAPPISSTTSAWSSAASSTSDFVFIDGSSTIGVFSPTGDIPEQSIEVNVATGVNLVAEPLPTSRRRRHARKGWRI